MFQKKNVKLNSNPRGPANVRGEPIGRSPMRKPEPRPSTESTPTNGSNPLIKPSLVTSSPCVSSGSRTLNRALGHGGLPLGTVNLIEEHGTTDFAASILKSCAAVSVLAHRSGAPCRVICVGMPDWLRTLPGISRERQSSSSAPSNSSKSADARMRIAWRYAKYAGQEAVDSPSEYSPDVDFKSTMMPPPKPTEVSYVLGRSLEELFAKLDAEVKSIEQSAAVKGAAKPMIKILAPSFLHPAIYSPECSAPDRLLLFLSELRGLVRQHANTIALLSIPLQLYPRTRSVIGGAELLVDTCIELEPLDSSDEKIQGFLHITKISKLSDRGENVEQRQELSFKLGRYQFEVTPYAIPLDITEQPEETKPETNW